MSLTYLYNTDICELTSNEAQIIAFPYDITPQDCQRDLFEKFPYTDIYSQETYFTPGTIKILGKNKRLVMALFVRGNSGFQECLDKIKKIKNLKSIAFPKELCYGHRIKEFSESCPKTKVFIVSKPNLEFLQWVWKQLEKSPLIDTKYLENEYEKTYVHVPPLIETKELTYENTSLEEFLSSSTPKGWEEFFQELKKEQYIEDISKGLKKKVKAGETIYPPLKDIFKAFEFCKPSSIKVVILGQDPYHNHGAAMGLSFSTPKGNKLQPSLRNIFKELERDGYRANYGCGDLTKWAKQGVFLVNTALTVKEGDPNSHRILWTDFMDQLFRYINEKCENLVVILWGINAKKYKDYFDDKKHYKILGGHPSPLNSKGDFQGTKPFSKANKILRSWEMKLIDWNLD